MATSLFRFERGSAFTALLHELKYRGNIKAGLYLGRLLGKEVLSGGLSACDVIVPVPLHRRRRKKRGYNQSEVIARGISQITGIPVVTTLLMRTGQVRSQTSLGRYDRFENVRGNFRICRNAPDVTGKLILLIDDVVTTGSTLEACCEEVLARYPCRICVATVSYA
jgi:ComF family protein